MTHGAEFFDVRMRGFKQRAEVESVLALLDSQAAPLPAECVPLAELARRVLAEPVISAVNVPGFARAAMDGYAVRAEDTFGAEPFDPRPLQLVGSCRPGEAFAGTVGSGQAVRIMTGAPLPAGADAVLMAEAAIADGDQVKATEAVSPGRHVGRVGEDVSIGNEVLPAGRPLRPQDLGLLAAIGHAGAFVVRRPRVEILVTGNELLPPGNRPQGYQIVDSNSPMLAALVARDGGVLTGVRHLADDYNTVHEAMASSEADVLLVSGGSSVGVDDHAPRALATLGTLAVHGVALRPASPTGIGFLEQRAVFLLPGNPVSCLCAYDLFAGRWLRQIGGRSGVFPYRIIQAALTSKVVSAIGRVDYVRVRLTASGAEPIAVSGASRLSSTVVADGFFLVERDREGHAAGEVLEIFRYD